MQVNSANAVCTLAAANGALREQLVAGGCVRVLAELLQAGRGGAARPNVCAVLAALMPEAAAREVGGRGATLLVAAAVWGAGRGDWPRRAHRHI